MNEHVVCTACGTPNSGDDAFCGACGTSLRTSTVPPLPCWNCRAPNPPGRAYCGQCGQPLAGPAYANAPDEAPRAGRNPVLLALAIVLVAFLGIVSGFLILTLIDDRGGGNAGGEPTAQPTAEPETAPPDATPTPTPTPKPRRTPKPTPTLGPPGTFVCNRSMSVEGPPGTKWDMVPVYFRTSRDYDRVIYQLTLTGRLDDGITPIANVSPQIEGEGEFVNAPPFDSSADSRISVVLANGVHDRSRLDAYEPNGMKIVKTLSTQRYELLANYSPPSDDPLMADVGLLSTIDVTGEGCFALRVVGWDGDGDDTAAVYVDIQR